MYLRLDGERILPIEYGRGVDGGITAVANEPPEALRIVVPIRVHARIELLDASEADAIAFLDEHGERTPINVYQGSSRRTTRTTPFADGRTDNLTLTDAVTTAVLMKAGEKVRDAAIQLRGGELQVIRL